MVDRFEIKYADTEVEMWGMGQSNRPQHGLLVSSYPDYVDLDGLVLEDGKLSSGDTPYVAIPNENIPDLIRLLLDIVEMGDLTRLAFKAMLREVSAR